MTPRETAVHFEAVKTKLSQDRNGILFTLAIHPDDVPEELVRAFVGSRWMCALVRLGDDDQPSPSQQQVDGVRAVQSAAMLCRTPAFQHFLVSEGLAELPDEASASVAVRQYLQVESRAALKADKAARRRFDELKTRFENRD